MTSLSDYDYDLPRELIAQHPLPNRIDSRLMVVNRRTDELTHEHIRDLPTVLRSDDLLVLNNTRVLPARLVGFRTMTGGKWQGLYLTEDAQGHWCILGKTRGKLEADETITLTDRRGHADTTLRLVVRMDEGQWAVRPETDEPTQKILERVGRVPLPHYIREGEMQEQDWQRYQTVFAQKPGSVAAPTAGLHFTDTLIQQLRDAGIEIQYVTLHVGIGTFRPISSENLEEHIMHSEQCELDEGVADAIRAAKRAGRRVLAVGTTSVRVLESAARSGEIQAWRGPTDLFIRPGFDFHVVDGLLTNFHLPRSSLLVLVRTFGGDSLMRRAYQAAVDDCYRFYSYGDAMLIV
ncbi:MAG: tRNA preQ1(34) S-adenosylmethionine ribosyltransferase-isomerase QueA [Planctomycetales bacterium]|nr:tRNA preQ1(34) S-adenosylmethionine ribosyltransferase-isomerase QueA [Planctomycetales bacterium]